MTHVYNFELFKAPVKCNWLISFITIPPGFYLDQFDNLVLELLDFTFMPQQFGVVQNTVFYITNISSFHNKIVMRCAIWYHLYNLINVKNTHGGMLILVRLQASACNFTKINTPPWVFFAFFKIVKMVPNRATHHKLRIYEQNHSKISHWQLQKILSKFYQIISLTFLVYLCVVSYI